MDAGTPIAAVKAHNGCCDGAADEQWGREHFVNKIETGPFYAARPSPALHDCYGGAPEEKVEADYDASAPPERRHVLRHRKRRS